MTKDDKPEIGRLLASKDHDYPFYFDGECFRTLNGIVKLDSIRCDGDYFASPVSIDPAQIDRILPKIKESPVLWNTVSLHELRSEILLLTGEELTIAS